VVQSVLELEVQLVLQSALESESWWVMQSVLVLEPRSPALPGMAEGNRHGGYGATMPETHQNGHPLSARQLGTMH